MGDPGAGKTTLFYYYAMTCMRGNFKKLGFNKPVFAIYYPLRELEYSKDNDSYTEQQHRYILECLKTIGNDDARGIVKEYLDSESTGESVRAYAQEIYAQTIVEENYDKPARIIKKGNTFRNPVEFNSEYIRIPGGTYAFSDTNEKVTVPELYFSKYTVTNRLYRLFSNFLHGMAIELSPYTSLEEYAEYFCDYINNDNDLREEIPADSTKWKQKFILSRNPQKRFTSPDQPVIEIDWYTARAYCFWLSYCYYKAVIKAKNIWQPEYGDMFRLPSEEEWEWAAAGRESDGTLREYPWPKEKGEPNEKLLNFNSNVGSTTPVGRYPDGATPEGLMDMAGNVWE